MATTEDVTPVRRHKRERLISITSVTAESFHQYVHGEHDNPVQRGQILAALKQYERRLHDMSSQQEGESAEYQSLHKVFVRLVHAFELISQQTLSETNFVLVKEKTRIALERLQSFELIVKPDSQANGAEIDHSATMKALEEALKGLSEAVEQVCKFLGIEFHEPHLAIQHSK